MLFWFCLIAFVVIAVGIGYLIFKAFTDDIEAVAGLMIVGFFLLLPMGITVLGTWNAHAEDLSKVTTQQHRIEVQERRISQLTERLESFDYPDSPTVLLNKDTPIASIVESLTEAENKLAQIRDERAKAIRSIESRRVGPVGGIVTIMGDGREE